MVVKNPGHGMEWKMEWNGTEILEWNMEDARMEWNGRFLEWNGRQSFILPYQFHSRFWNLAFTEKYIRIVITKNMWKRLAANYLR